jgi:hypothetical protein
MLCAASSMESMRSLLDNCQNAMKKTAIAAAISAQTKISRRVMLTFLPKNFISKVTSF